MKKKRFRIEKLFINYITQNNIGLEKIARHLESSSVNSDLVRDDLKRGWYNELAYVFPLKKSVLGLGFKHLELNKEISSARFSFPSWKIITAYYSMYFYLRSLVLYKNSSFRLGEHSATISSFNHNAFDSLSESLLYFPFNIAYRPRHRIIKKQLPIYALRHLRYGYSSHPREPWSSPSEIYEKIRREFADRGKSSLSGRKPRAYTIFNFLKDFRIWANYLDIDNLLSLWGPGYLGYLDQNLSLFCFFIGGLAELAFISQYGQAKYIENLQVLYSLVSDRVDKDVARNFVETPPYQRMTIFKKLGFVTNQIVLREQDSVNRMDL